MMIDQDSGHEKPEGFGSEVLKVIAYHSSFNQVGSALQVCWKWTRKQPGSDPHQVLGYSPPFFLLTNAGLISWQVSKLLETHLTNTNGSWYELKEPSQVFWRSSNLNSHLIAAWSYHLGNFGYNWDGVTSIQASKSCMDMSESWRPATFISKFNQKGHCYPCWLVVSTPLKNISQLLVCWGYYSQYMGEKKCSKPPETHSCNPAGFPHRPADEIWPRNDWDCPQSAAPVSGWNSLLRLEWNLPSRTGSHQELSWYENGAANCFPWPFLYPYTYQKIHGAGTSKGPCVTQKRWFWSIWNRC